MNSERVRPSELEDCSKFTPGLTPSSRIRPLVIGGENTALGDSVARDSRSRRRPSRFIIFIVPPLSLGSSRAATEFHADHREIEYGLRVRATFSRDRKRTRPVFQKARKAAN